MSFVGDLKKLSLSQIPDRMEIYEEYISSAEPYFELKGKNLEEANMQHVQILVIYDTMLQEAKTVEEYLKQKMDEVEASLYRHYIETSKRALGTTDLKMYVRGDPQYVEANQILLDVTHTRKQLEAIVEGMKLLGWTLSNIVKLRVAQLDHVVL
jgi:hypothetical protein